MISQENSRANNNYYVVKFVGSTLLPLVSDPRVGFLDHFPDRLVVARGFWYLG
jgi:hypothetical protein